MNLSVECSRARGAGGADCAVTGRADREGRGGRGAGGGAGPGGRGGAAQPAARRRRAGRPAAALGRPLHRRAAAPRRLPAEQLRDFAAVLENLSLRVECQRRCLVQPLVLV